MEIKSVLVPVTFAPSAEKALKLAARLAIMFSARLYILDAYKSIPKMFYATGSGIDVERDTAIQALEAVVKREVERLVPTIEVEELEPGEEDPVKTVLSVAAKEKIDLLVIGHHEGLPLEHHLMGRNVDMIVEAAPCDVIVTRSDRYREEALERLAA